MATLTHHHEPVVAEHLQEHPGLQRTFVTIIIAGVIVLALGLLAAFMGWGAHHEAAGHAAAAGHDAAAGHAEHGGYSIVTAVEFNHQVRDGLVLFLYA